ncbi:hypothetical protein J2X34_005693 [Rhodococcus sp. BE178]
MNVLFATITTEHAAPVIAPQRLRKGACGSPRGGHPRRGRGSRFGWPSGTPGLAQPHTAARADSAFYGHVRVGAAIKGGADVSVTVRLDPKVRAAIAQIEADAWFPIEYTTTDHAELGTGTADKTHRLLWLDW